MLIGLLVFKKQNGCRKLYFLASLISELRSSVYKLYILSTNSRHIIEKFLFKHQITGFQNTYCARNLFGKNKKIDQFIKKHQIKRQEAIYIGDELRDIIACKQSSSQR